MESDSFLYRINILARGFLVNVVAIDSRTYRLESDRCPNALILSARLASELLLEVFAPVFDGSLVNSFDEEYCSLMLLILSFPFTSPTLTFTCSLSSSDLAIPVEKRTESYDLGSVEVKYMSFMLKRLSVDVGFCFSPTFHSLVHYRQGSVASHWFSDGFLPKKTAHVILIYQDISSPM